MISSLSFPLQYSPVKSKYQQQTHWQHLFGSSHTSRRRGGPKCLVNWDAHSRKKPGSILKVSILHSFLNCTIKKKWWLELNECSQSIPRQSDTNTWHHNGIITLFFTMSWYLQCSRCKELSPYAPLYLYRVLPNMYNNLCTASRKQEVQFSQKAAPHCSQPPLPSVFQHH